MSGERDPGTRKRLNPLVVTGTGLIVTALATFYSADQKHATAYTSPIYKTPEAPKVTEPIDPSETTQAILIEPTPPPIVEAIKEPPIYYWVFAHPDDETLAAAAAIKESQDQGNHNVVILISSGENTVVGRRLGLSKQQTTVAREKESRAALAVIGITDVRYFDIPDGQVTPEFVRGIVDDLVNQTNGQTIIRTHSPKDPYVGQALGHPDHVAVALGVKQAEQDGKISDVRYYNIGQLFGSAAKGYCSLPTPNQLKAMKAMADEYKKYNSSTGRYGIAFQSVSGAWSLFLSKPECFYLSSDFN